MNERPPTELLLGEGADETFAALADRTRRQILVRLAERPDDAGAIARDLEVSRQAVAKHLRVLEEAGFVRAAKQSRRRVHHVDAARVREISDLLGVVAHGWDRRLAGIRAEVEQRAAASDRPHGDSPHRAKSVRIFPDGDDAGIRP
ncbi:MAG: ArsR/SmtB family transcription factor [Brachybacterium sp.]|uniref:ArsR/SmtB family transcription factor n=1 Tax=Brachybacterium sp. TaxID=1891286 RepID=UPI0026547AE0|nr:metalloregulator ArsR/SmtB family transcription factor [Brachybacterium sp.]MDN6302802.1 metalloregulator ArsR/SmtB family transcription factor [Brachybacterium sp.]MDN6328667.1 metalloregulator ArsR/SmtB family transcription factor [Brachybacterium sp.]